MDEFTSKQNTWCKICGISNLGDAQMVAASGADALGLNFWPGSKRFVATAIAAEICQQVEVTKVALFVDPEASYVESVLQTCRVDVLQFQGDETEDFCRQFGLPFIKAIRVSSDMEVGQVLAEFTNAWAVMLDASVAGQKGGTGHRFDWQLWPSDPIDANLVLAGGLNADNVAAGIEQLTPWGVDVSTGVEVPNTKPPEKSPQAVQQFISAVRGASG